MPCMADYTGNHSSRISSVKIYNNNVIYFQLENMPTDHKCQYNYFTLASNLTEEQRERYFSMLLAARASQATVSVGYDKNNPACETNRPLVHALEY